LNDIQELRNRLDKLKHDAFVAAERKALRATGKVILEAVTEVCPIQAGEPEGLLKPGELKASFRAYVHIVNDIGIAEGKADDVTVTPSTTVCKNVAHWVERGHAGRTPDSKRTKPHPFIRPAQDSIEAQAKETYTAVMTEEIKKAFHGQ